MIFDNYILEKDGLFSSFLALTLCKSLTGNKSIWTNMSEKISHLKLIRDLQVKVVKMISPDRESKLFLWQNISFFDSISSLKESS
jgi:hypothetical protein